MNGSDKSQPIKYGKLKRNNSLFTQNSVEKINQWIVQPFIFLPINILTINRHNFHKPRKI